MKTAPQFDGYLEKLIHHLSDGKKFHISIHFLNGSFIEHKCMELSPPHCFHNCEFCNFIKTSPQNLKRCMKNKGLAINKITETGLPLTGTCHMGLTEIMVPVIIGEKVACIVSLGHLLLKSGREKVKERVLRTCRQSGMDADEAVKKIDFLHEIRDGELGYYEELARLVADSILLCAGYFPKTAPKSEPGLPASKNLHWIIRQTINYINQYYYSSLKLTDLAGHFFVNPQYLCRLFARETGVPCSEYINSVRVNKAKELLSHSIRPVADVAFSVGFNSVTYFNYVFKKHSGMTPIQFRQQNNG